MSLPLFPRDSKKMPIAIGRITKPHGVQGEMKVNTFFDDILVPLIGTTITLSPDKGGVDKTVTLESVRGGGDNIIALTEIETPEEVLAAVAPGPY